MALCLAVAVVLVTVATSVTAVHLARHRLQGLADHAALDAADAIDRQRFYTGGAGQAAAVVPLSDSAVRAAVVEHLSRDPGVPGAGPVRIEHPTGSPDGVTVQVTLSAQVRLRLISVVTLGRASGVEVRVQARAQSRAWPPPAALPEVAQAGVSPPSEARGNPPGEGASGGRSG